MALQLRKSGQSTWTTVTPGGVLYRKPDSNTWTTATSVKVQVGGAWVDSGYVAYPEPTINLREETPGTGDTKDPLTGYRVITVVWNAPVERRPAPTGTVQYSLSVG